jgi:AraC family transcriptional regulator
MLLRRTLISMSNIAPISDSRLRPGQFLGKVVNSRTSSGLILSELKHSTGKKLCEHSHQLANFCFLLNGDYLENWGSETIVYRPMTIMFHPPELTHSDEIGKHGGHFFNIELDADWMNSLRDYAFIPERPVGAKGGDLGWLALKLYREFRSERPSPLAIEGLVMTMLSEVQKSGPRDDTRSPRWLAHAVELLHAEFKTNLTINFVAQQIGVHPFHLARVFKRFHEQTIGDYVKSLRINFACQELLKHDTDLSDIALAAGFADQSHFTRVFKQVTGLTPGAFRGVLTPRRKST